ncbi:helix-turn-helix transcriptional regulator [Lachnospiraceae bacterium 54-53]
MDNEAVLKKIEEICKSKEWSMYRLSKESGIAQSTLSSLFGRRANISLPKLGRICQALGLKLSDFFSLLEAEARSGEPEQKNYETIEMIQKAETLSKNNRRLLRSMIMVMEELEREMK